MVGIVLCGGNSSRMGNDKGMLTLGARTWAEIAASKITASKIVVNVSVREAQFPVYSEIFASSNLIADNPSLLVKGPLLGLLSCHLKYATEDLLVLACDMPMMNTSILDELIARYLSGRSYDAYLYAVDDEPEPLCAIYTSRALEKICKMLTEGQLARHSMKFMLSQLDIDIVAASDLQKDSFHNFNDRNSLNDL